MGGSLPFLSPLRRARLPPRPSLEEALAKAFGELAVKGEVDVALLPAVLRTPRRARCGVPRCVRGSLPPPPPRGVCSAQGTVWVPEALPT